MVLPDPDNPISTPEGRRDKWHHWVSSPRKGGVRTLVKRMKSRLSPDSTKTGEPRNGAQAQNTPIRNVPVRDSRAAETLLDGHGLGNIISTPGVSTASSSEDNGGNEEFSPPKRVCSTAPSEERPTGQVEVEQLKGCPDLSEQARGGNTQAEKQEKDDQQECEVNQEHEDPAEIEVEVDVDADVSVEVEVDISAEADEDMEDTGEEQDDDADDEADDNEDEEEEDEQGMIPSREVDFLLENAEQNRLNDLAALQDEFDDEIRYIVQERNTLLTEKMFWQTKFVTAIKGREKQRSRASSATQDNSRLEAIGNVLKREMDLIQEIVDKQFKEVKEIKASCLDAVTQLTQACEVTKSYLDQAKEENMKTAKELAILRKIVMKIRQPSKNLTEFSMHHDFQQTLETNQELKDRAEAQQEELNQLHAELAERDATIEKLETIKTKLEDQLDYMGSSNAKYRAKLEETDRTLADCQKSLRDARDREARLKGRLSTVYKEWATRKEKLEVDLTECQAKLQLKESMVEVLSQQSSMYLDNWKDSISMLAGQSQGDELSSKLADCLQETLDRNEALEIELCELREETLTLLDRTLG
ncbi:uncharacterized protein GIQ15_06407 [Arthroderma uncinatum]|uniref:uncharacterized protein n=1 Tax=Arthroderma uncinatum TaxID=74035 RepID=UPI00144A855F|nr:uncharacterized protein GIQ15_06407 [Arthroderma uncinatum]KAF3479431.1 hypothetical protein GIQ15_06407 [Arthroderma uncinatum]